MNVKLTLFAIFAIFCVLGSACVVCAADDDVDPNGDPNIDPDPDPNPDPDPDPNVDPDPDPEPTPEPVVIGNDSAGNNTINGSGNKTINDTINKTINGTNVTNNTTAGPAPVFSNMLSTGNPILILLIAVVVIGVAAVILKRK